MSLLMGLFIAKNDLRFLTLKGDKYQKIGKVSDLIRKISDHYYVVRETNKKTTGYHFHALLECKKEPPKAWFKKGVHMNLQKVGKPSTTIGMTFPEPSMNQNQLSEMIYHEPETAPLVEDLIFEKQLKTSRATIQRRTNLGRVLHYMEKEQELPAQYSDYILVINKKHIKLQ